jgi:hypothetical protein
MKRFFDLIDAHSRRAIQFSYAHGAYMPGTIYDMLPPLLPKIARPRPPPTSYLRASVIAMPPAA